MVRIPPLLLALIAPLALAACDPHMTGKTQDRISLATTESVMSFSFARAGTQLTGRDQQKLRRLLQQSGAGPKDRIVISLPAGATAAQTRQREQHLRSLVAATGAQIELIGDRPGERRPRVEDRGMLRIVQADRMTIRCPEPGEAPTGCSQSQNLAVMLAEPVDLIFPRVQARGTARPKLPRAPEGGTPAAGAGLARGTAQAAPPQ